MKLNDLYYMLNEDELVKFKQVEKDLAIIQEEAPTGTVEAPATDTKSTSATPAVSGGTQADHDRLAKEFITKLNTNDVAKKELQQMFQELIVMVPSINRYIGGLEITKINNDGTGLIGNIKFKSVSASPSASATTDTSSISASNVADINRTNEAIGIVKDVIKNIPEIQSPKLIETGKIEITIAPKAKEGKLIDIKKFADSTYKPTVISMQTKLKEVKLELKELSTDADKVKQETQGIYTYLVLDNKKTKKSK